MGDKEIKKITLGFIISWFLGGLILISGITSIFSQPIFGILLLLIAAILLPPVNNFFIKKFKFSISGGLKFVIILILLIIAGTILKSKETNESIIINNQETLDRKQVVEHEWVEIESFQGSGSRNTASFELTGNESKIHWTFEDTSGFGSGLFSFYLVPSGTDLKETGGFPEVMITGTSDSGTQYIHNKKGLFYININSANGPWEIVVEDLK